MEKKGLVGIGFLVILIYGTLRCIPAAAIAEDRTNEQHSTNNIQQVLCAVNHCPACVVRIKCISADGSGQTGTGVLLADGRILTAAHVVENQSGRSFNQIKIVFGGRDGNQPFDGAAGRALMINLTGPDADLAVITGVALPGFARNCGAEIATATPKVGDLLTSVGLEHSSAVRVHTGPVLGWDSSRPMLYIGVSAQHGDSGGPVFDQDGKLAGINSAIGGYTQIKARNIGALQGIEERVIDSTFIIDLTNPSIKTFISGSQPQP